MLVRLLIGVVALWVFAIPAGAAQAGAPKAGSVPVKQLGVLARVPALLKANSLREEAQQLTDAGNHKQALAKRREALYWGKAIHGETSHFVGGYHNEVASSYKNLGDFVNSEAHFQRSIELQTGNHENPLNLLSAHYNYSGMLDTVGRIEESRSHLTKAQTLLVDYPDHAYGDAVRDRMIYFQVEDRRFDEAGATIEQLLKAANATRDPRELATAYDHAAHLQWSLGRHEEALDYLARLFALSRGSAMTAADLSKRGLVLRSAGRHAEAADALRQSIEQERKAGLGETYYAASTMIPLANSLLDLGRLQEAEERFTEALTIMQRNLPEDHPEITEILEGLSRVETRKGNNTRALELIRQATTMQAQRLRKLGGSYTTQLRASSKQRSAQFNHLIKILNATRESDGPLDEAQLAESFAAAQYSLASDDGVSIARMAAGFAASNDGLRELVRRLHDAQMNWQWTESRMAAQPANDTERRALRARLLSLEREIGDLNATLGEAFPEYASLVGNTPLPMSRARQLLDDDEALLVFVIGEQASFVLAVRNGHGKVAEIATNRTELADQTNRLYRGLELRGGRLPRFPAKRAHELYRTLLGPVESVLQGVNRLVIVADGSLNKLPLHVLIDSPPQLDAIDGSNSTRSIGWVAQKFAVSVLPSVSSLEALRAGTRTSRGDKTLVGFADPVLLGAAGGTRSYAANVGRRATGGVDAEVIRNMTALPETRDELEAISAALGSAREDLYFGSRATETNLKSLDLQNYKVVVFATHALMSGEFAGLTEPALVLTPPARPQADDDGLLVASEVAALKLDSDWTVLSACNTGNGAEGLSSLANAFFYAGSRSLVVSHWAVDSKSANQLVTGAFAEVGRDARMHRSVALQNAMLQMINSADAVQSHPALWAPFSIVGYAGPLRNPPATH